MNKRTGWEERENVNVRARGLQEKAGDSAAGCHRYCLSGTITLIATRVYFHTQIELIGAMELPRVPITLSRRAVSE